MSKIAIGLMAIAIIFNFLLTGCEREREKPKVKNRTQGAIKPEDRPLFPPPPRDWQALPYKDRGQEELPTPDLTPDLNALVAEDQSLSPIPTPKPAAVGGIFFTLQISTFTTSEGAAAGVNRLKQRGIEAFYREVPQGPRKVYLVCHGRFTDFREAAKVGQELRKKGKIDAFQIIKLRENP